MKKLSAIDKDFIIKNYGVMKTIEIAEKVGLTTSGISIFAKRNNLKKEVRFYNTGKNWTESEIKHLIDNWSDSSVSDLMKSLNKTKWAITSKKYELVKLGLFITVEKAEIGEIESDEEFRLRRRKMWEDLSNNEFMSKNDIVKQMMDDGDIDMADYDDEMESFNRERRSHVSGSSPITGRDLQ